MSRKKNFFRINTSKTTEDFYRFTLHFFPKYCNIKQQVSLNCTLNAHWERGKVCDSLSRHSDRVKYVALCSHVALKKKTIKKDVRKEVRPHAIVKYLTHVILVHTL